MRLGEIAAARPASIPVFERLGLDYCCGGSRSFSQACAQAGLEPAGVLAKIAEQENAPTQTPTRNWSEASMSELADHIERTHHAFVRDALARLETIVPRVLRAHGAKDPRLAEVATILGTFAAEMHDHMVREERVLFPWLRRLESRTAIEGGPPWSVRRPITCMVHDHDDAGEALAAMRALTDGYTPPPGACATYRSMLDILRTLESDMHEHIHKENNILFPAGVRAEDDRAQRQAAALARPAP
jgi:regulator of cell morphogenesis and NO signaling